jgi:hypothetical protein
MPRTPEIPPEVLDAWALISGTGLTWNNAWSGTCNCSMCFEQCVERCALVCSDCARRNSRGSYWTPLRTPDGMRQTCPACQMNYEWCSHCSIYHRRGTRAQMYGTFIDGSWTCEPCAESADECDECGEPTWYPSDHCADEYHDDDDDYRSGSVIHGYSYRPNPVFHGDGPAYLGFELEVDAVYPYDLVAKVVRPLAGEDVIYAKEDGSVAGVELVSHPMTYDWALASFPWEMLDKIKKTPRCSAGDNGLHVHVSRAAFIDAAHVLRWQLLVYRNAAQVKLLARRQSDQWASFGDAKQLIRKSQGGSGFTRYVAINAQNSATFEVRVFASSLERDEVQAALGFVAAGVEFAREVKPVAALADGLTWAAFYRWVGERQDRYGALHREMTRLCPPPSGGTRRPARRSR